MMQISPSVWTRYRIGAASSVPGYLQVEDALSNRALIGRYLPKTNEIEDALCRWETIRHPCFAPWCDVLTLEDRLFLIFEHPADALPFDHPKHAGLYPTTLADVFRELTAALLFLSDMGIEHPVFNPSKIFLKTGRPIRILGHEVGLMNGAESGGLVNLDIRYAAPEVIHRKPAGLKSDVYHLGALMVRLVTGRVLVPGETIHQIASRARRRLRREWDNILAAVLAPNPAQRPDPRQLYGQLLSLRETSSSPRRTRVWLAGTDQPTMNLLQDWLQEASGGLAALQVLPGPESRASLKPLVRKVKPSFAGVFELDAAITADQPFQLLNDLLFLLRQTAADHHDQMPSLNHFRGFSPWDDQADQLAQWRKAAGDLAHFRAEAAKPELLFVIQQADRMDRRSAALLPDFMAALQPHCHVILTGASFVETFWRKLAQAVPRMLWLHPTLSISDDDETAGPRLWLPETGFSGLDPQLCFQADGEACRILHALFETDHVGGSLLPFLKAQWSALEDNERLTLKVLAGSQRPLSAEELKRAGHTGSNALLEPLIRLRLVLATPAGYHIPAPAVRAFCRQRWTKLDAEQIRNRLLQNELAHDQGDLVQILVQAAHLKLKTHITDSLNQLRKRVYHQLDTELLFRLAQAHNQHAAPELREFADLAACLRGGVVKGSKLPAGAVAAVKANRRYLEGDFQAAADLYHTLAARRNQPAGLVVFGLVRQAECRERLKDRLGVGKVLRKFQKAQFASITPQVLADFTTRLYTAALLMEVTWEDQSRSDEILSPAQKAWLACVGAWVAHDFESAALHRGQALPYLEDHDDLGFKGLALRLCGNVDYRRFQPQSAARFYQRSVRCFKDLGAERELEDSCYNLAGAEKLAGRFEACVQRFQPIMEAARQREDLATVCFALYFLMNCRLYQNKLADFDQLFREHHKLARKCRLSSELAKALAVRLHSALLRTKDEVRADMTELSAVLNKFEPDPLLRDECTFALRFGAFALGAANQEVPKPYPKWVRWRHQLLDVLYGLSAPSPRELVAGIGDDFFSACGLFLLRTLVERDLPPFAQMGSELLPHFQRHGRKPGVDYRRFIKTCFARTHRPGDASRLDWERALQIFEAVRWDAPNPRKLQRDLIAEMQKLRPFSHWGACVMHNELWETHFRENDFIDDDIRYHLNQLNPTPLEGPMLAPLNHGAGSELLVLPITMPGERRGVIWFLGEDQGFSFDMHESLLRFHAKLFECLLSPVGRSRSDPTAAGGRWGVARAHGIVGSSTTIRELHTKIQMLAPSNLNVYIWGESGSGKELTARALHRASDRADKPFRAVNCNHYTETLVEAELFGYVKGAFTGATTDKVGLLEMVDGGTLFLDEIGDISPKIQSLLLRVIQEGEFSRLGELSLRKADIRFITATNKNIHRMIDEGGFRGDLYFRMVEEEIHLPALRDRLDDLPELAAHFAKKHQSGRAVTFGSDFFDLPLRYHWPGNIREFESYIRKLLVHYPNVARFTAEHQLPFLRTEVGNDPDSQKTLRELERAYRERLIEERLIRHHGNRSAAAKSLGLTRQRLATLISRRRIEQITAPFDGEVG